ncbi:MAG: SpoIIE family protein phosphatase [Firmicutes bacterium]|nr:SpoIIE family protein phosphatase [Bacillota bacterium]
MANPHIARGAAARIRTPIIKDIAVSAILFLVSRAGVLDMFPFGVAFFAACFDINVAYLGVAVIFTSLIISGAGIATVKYIIAALLFWLFDKLRPDSAKTVPIEATACGVSVCVGGMFALIADFGDIYDILMLVTEGIISAMMFLVFSKAYRLIQTRKNRTQAAKDEIVSVAISAGVIITGFSGIVFPLGIKLTSAAAVYAVLTIAYHSTLSAAGSGGLCIGFMTSMVSSDAFVSMGLMGLCGLFSNLLKSFGKIGAAVGMIGGLAAAMLYAPGSALPITLLEAGIGALLFVLTPKKLHNFIQAFFSSTLTIENVSLETRVKDYLASRLGQLSSAFTALNACFSDASEKRLKMYSKEIGAMFDEVSERVCASCPKANKCWQSEFSSTYRMVMGLLNKIEKEGVLTAAPQEFKLKCSRSDTFIAEFNHVYEIYKNDMLRTGEAITNRDLISSQYKEISSVIDGISTEIEDGFVFREDFEEAAMNETDKYGINLFEISVVETTQGQLEIFAGLGMGSDLRRAEAVFTEITGTPIGYSGTEKNGIMRFVSKAKYEIDFAVKQQCKDYSRACGDSVSVFKSDDYRMYFLLSDGMGSGKRASEESRLTLKLLTEFLKSGFGVRNSIEMINSSLCLKLTDECFATIDLLSVDLMTGFSEFYKVGAAQSFVYTADGVDTVFSASIPAGMLKTVKVQEQTKRLVDGDTILMISDGVSEAGFTTVRTEWIKKEITGLYDNMEDMAENIINTAIRKSRDTVVDDMSVIAIRLNET